MFVETKCLNITDHYHIFTMLRSNNKAVGFTVKSLDHSKKNIQKFCDAVRNNANIFDAITGKHLDYNPLLFSNLIYILYNINIIQ